MRWERTKRVARGVLVWLIGSVLLPISLVGFIVAVKRVPLDNAIDRGEFFALGIAIAGGAIVIEMLLRPGKFVASFSQGCLLLSVIAQVAFYFGSATTRGVGHGANELTTVLDDSYRAWSVVLLGFSILFGAFSVGRQVLDSSNRPIVP